MKFYDRYKARKEGVIIMEYKLVKKKGSLQGDNVKVV